MSPRHRLPLAQLGIALAVLAVAFFAAATLTKDAQAGAGAVIGDVSWFGFLISAAACLLVAAAALVRALIGRIAAGTDR